MAPRTPPGPRHGPIHIELSPSAAHVRTARLAAVAAAREWGVSVDLLDEVRLAVGEACTRAVTSHAELGLNDPVVVEISTQENPSVFSVLVRDRGAARSDTAWDSMSDTHDFVDTLTTDTAAVELAIASRLVPDMKVIPLPEGGTEIHMQWPLAE